jgi:hypothetical protein
VNTVTVASRDDNSSRASRPSPTPSSKNTASDAVAVVIAGVYEVEGILA